MQCSLIGNLAEASLLVNSIQLHDEHQIGAVFVRGALLERLSRRFPDGASRVSNPEDAIHRENSQVVIVAESEPEEAMSLARQASQSDRHVIVIPPAEASTAFSYELHLLLDESRSGILVLTGRWYLPEALQNSVSNIRDVVLGLPAPAADVNHRATVLYAVDCVSGMGFGMSQVTVLDIPGERELPDSRQIVFAESPQNRLGRPGVSIHCSGSVEPFRLRSQSTPEILDQLVTIPVGCDHLSAEQSSSLVFRVFQELQQRSNLQKYMESFSETLQMRQAIESSIRRRRTVDIYLDGLTERNAFKTQMTAIGCGVLTWILVGMIGFLLLGQLEPPRPVMYLLRILWVAPAVLFLAAQLLLPLARGRASDSSASLSAKESDS